MIASRMLMLCMLGALTGCPGSNAGGTCANVTCAQGRVCVEGRCVESSKTCGGVTCPAGTACVAGQCVAPCADGGCPDGRLDASLDTSLDTRLDTRQDARQDSSVAFCGDGTCKGSESCASCPGDCGACPASCGNGQCDGTETCQICPADCGACPAACGDGTCNGSESCASCPADCGACPAACGDGKCNGTETCTSCPGDCGACPPNCGDGQCNGTESCLNCAGDCGACECTPGKTEKDSAVCQPCQDRLRTCGADGKWGAWGACASFCAGTAVCVNNTCAVCTPTTTETQNCPCGTQLRTCGAAGAWGPWGTCVTTCTATYSCLAVGRCGKQYTAMTNAGGAECGSTWNGSYYTTYYCYPGDYCENATQKLCRVFEAYKAGDLYHSYTNAGGAECGSKWNGSYYTYYYCKPGDLCSNATNKACAYAGTACDAIYTSYTNAGGPECGSKWNGSYYTYYYCRPGDYCSNPTSQQCKIVTSCPAGAIYHAYANAGGPQCGSKWNGSYYTYYYCKPGDLCQNASSKQCKQ